MSVSQIDQKRNGDRKPFSILDAVRQVREQETSRQLEHIPVTRLTPFKRNARTHSSQQLRRLAECIKKFGLIVPVLVNAENEIVAGHARVEAAKLLGLKKVPVLRVTHLSPAEQRAFVIADNRLAELAGWDRNTLAVELKSLIELDFDIEVTGFDMGEVMLEGQNDGSDDESIETKIQKASSAPSISRRGDVWQLGQHRLTCGDSIDASYAAVDAAIRCWQKATGVAATLAGSGESFKAIARKRRNRAPARRAGLPGAQSAKAA